MIRRLLFLALVLSLGGSGQAHGLLHAEIAQLTAELDQFPNDPARLAQRGELFRVHGLFSEARLDWDKVAALLPNDVTNDLRLGLLELGVRNTNAAVKRLDHFLEARPSSLEGQLAAAEAETLAGNSIRAVAHWSTAIGLSDEPRPDWYLHRARAGQSAGQSPNQILEGLDAGIARYGPLPSLQLMAVDLEVQRGAIDAALARLDALAARADRKERWFVRRGDVLVAAGQPERARAEFLAAQRALESLPEKLRRSWTANELRQQIDTKLAALSPVPSSSK
ncbi:MAG TPA: tetratricopeptide repeat protein [Verrucomicrobiota bacterium]|nr:tetratricopeptide repeat protein [Verrucomicrobiota bacterium]